jgi:hypothetical protein
MAFWEELSRIGNIVSNTASDIKSTIDPEYARFLLEREKLRTVKEDKPSDVRSFEYWNQLNPEQQKNFLALKRAQQIMDLGGTKAVYDPMTGSVGSQFQVTPPPSLQPDVVSAAESAKEGAKLGQQLEIEPEITLEKKRAEQRAENEKSLPAKSSVTEKLNQITDLYTSLGGMGALVDTDKNIFDNISARAASTAPGQYTSGFIGTKEQEIRDQIAMMRPTLINDIRQASQMGARGLDSEKELEFYLQAATDTTKSLKSNLTAISVLNNAYGLGSLKASDPKEREKLKKEFEQKLKEAKQTGKTTGKPMVKTEDSNGWSARRID